MPFSGPERSQEPGERVTNAPKAETAAPEAPVVRRRPAGRLRPSQVPARSPQEVLRGTGRPLDPPLREEMEHRLGADFSAVRVHADGAARASAAELGARAYTAGEHVVAGDGNVDKQTLAHELSHVLQQRERPVAGTSHGEFRLSNPGDADERAAEATAQRVMSGSEPDQDHRRPASARPPAAHPVAATPAIQRVVQIGMKKYSAPDDPQSDEYEEEKKRFTKSVLRPVLKTYGEEKGSTDDAKIKIASLLYSYWEREGDSIEAASRAKLINKLVTELSNPKRRGTRQERDFVRRLVEIDSRARSTKTRGWDKKEMEKKLHLGGRILTLPTGAANPPKKMKVSGRKIFQASRSFKAKFSAKYWELWDEWAKGGWPIICKRCSKPITAGEPREIDHSQSWSKLQAAIETMEVCKSGHHWTVALQENADYESHDGPTDPSDLEVKETKTPILDESGKQIGVEAYMTRKNDRDESRRSNLQPMHEACNASKSGQKGIDSLAPQPSKDPPHDPKDDCGLDKAV